MLNDFTHKVVVRFGGGLGNQMFNYVTALKLAQETGRELCLDSSEYLIIKNRKYQLDVFKGPAAAHKCGICFTMLALVVRILQQYRVPGIAWALRLLGIQWSHCYALKNDEPYLTELKEKFVSSQMRMLYISGCCSDIRGIVDRNLARKVFCPIPPVEFATDENSVSLHIRRGDYIECKWALDERYYRAAIARIYELVDCPKWYVFSDDVAWCREKYGDLEDVTFVEGDVNYSWQDIVKMSRCRHHIIANSTFSWWGAFLSRGDGYTICPDPWLYDFPTTAGIRVPDDWIHVPSGL